MKRFGFILIIVCGIFVGCQSKSSNVYDFQDYKDYSFIDDYIEDKQVVLLGESSHWTQDFTEVGVDLVRYLHEHHDFSILALETSKAELEYFTENLEPLNRNQDFEYAVLESWVNDEMASLAQYASDTGGFEMKGLDWIPVSSHPNEGILQHIISEMNEIDPDLGNQFALAESTFTKHIPRLYFEVLSIDHNYIDELLESYQLITETEYFSQLDSTIQTFIDDRIYVLKRVLNEDYLADYKINDDFQDIYSRRGLGMLHELENIMDEHPHEKVIIWAHNGHIQKEFSQINNIDTNLADIFQETPLVFGSLVDRELDLETYYIGMYFNEGELVSQGDVERKEEEGFLEYELSLYNYDRLFVDLHSKSWAEELRIAHDDGVYQYEMVPSEQYDGLIYIDTVTSH
ncbi:erythromycin esterase family protein [Alkalibacillus silvisoli]|uniref:Erythromycin esterase family protein n=1 Tax=Alkalibacillus silvisoli TaxID=392823 RepID=A0ABN0ZQV4_9BACI